MATSSWLRLAGRVAVVTGAGSGIGATVSYALASQGCHVILADTDVDKAMSVAKLCSSTGDDSGGGGGGGGDGPTMGKGGVAGGSGGCDGKPGDDAGARAATHQWSPSRPRVATVQCDVTDSFAVQRLISKADEVAESVLAEEDEGCPTTLFLDAPMASILVNCAGITRDAFIQNMTEEEFDEVIDVNLRGTFLTCKYFASNERLESLASSPTSSSIINISSIVGQRGNKGQSNYAASKAGVYGMTKSLAKELAGYNVRANAILPGFIDTPMSAKVPERVKDRMISNIGLKRFGTTDNVADLILFLASERSAYITGEGIEISGAISF